MDYFNYPPLYLLERFSVISKIKTSKLSSIIHLRPIQCHYNLDIFCAPVPDDSRNNFQDTIIAISVSNTVVSWLELEAHCPFRRWNEQKTLICNM